MYLLAIHHCTPYVHPMYTLGYTPPGYIPLMYTLGYTPPGYIPLLYTLGIPPS